MADPSLAMATHGCFITMRTSSSDIVWNMPEIVPPSSAMSARQVSAGSASPRSFAIWLSRIPSYFLFCGCVARPSTMPSQPPCSCDPGLEILVLFDLLAHRRILQSIAANCLRPALARPDREERAPAMLHRRVRILIGGDVEPARARRLDLREVLADRAPVVLAANLEVEDVDGDLRFLGHANREVQFLVLLHALRCRCATRRCRRCDGHDLRDLDDFVRMLRPAALESRDESPGAFLHRAGGELLHPLELRGVAGPAL